MRDYQQEFDARVAFIRDTLNKAHARAIVFGNSGGKDSALVGILCKAACDDVLGVMMPCGSAQNYGSDIDDAVALAEQFGIPNIQIDLTPVRQSMLDALASQPPSEIATSNIAPRLRMTTLYAIAQTRGALVAGTSNRSERHLGYFTKWGDGACDFNPIVDLTVTEVFDFLAFLGAPDHIRSKAPSAGLREGQTDEKELGLRYADVDRYLETGQGSPDVVARIEGMHARTTHKRGPALFYGENNA